MKLSPYVEYLLGDALSAIDRDRLTVRRMFGGHGFYLDNRIFGFTIEGDILVLKGNEASREKFESRNGEQFIYKGHKNKKPVAMPYWTVPPEILENPDELALWAEASAALSEPKGGEG